jgi:rare lipoprotein A (peptidoglycan hydrolase)
MESQRLAHARSIGGVLALLSLSAFIVCSPAESPPAVAGNDGNSLRVFGQSFSQVGLASWYGRENEGRRTASGQPFNPNELTAAHTTLPLGTVVKVTNLETGKSVRVRINDRGPYVGRRILDLSAAAGRTLDIRRLGVARVRVDVVAPNQ